MDNLYDDDLEARCAEIRSRHHSTWDDYDRDDIASWHMLRGFEDRAERKRDKAIIEAMERDLRDAVREINGIVIRLPTKH